MREPDAVSVSARNGICHSSPGEVVSGIQATSIQIKFQKEPPCCLCGRAAFHIQEYEMSKIANYCGVVLLLRQLVEAGHCTTKEAARIAARVARQSGVDINLPIA